MVDLELVPTSFFHPDPYPRLCNWDELKQIVDCGDLDKLLRHPKFQEEYDAANLVLAKEHGSVVNFLTKIRLGWDMNQPIGPEARSYFTSDVPEGLVRVVFNDWPYSVPSGVSHYVVWTRLSLVHPDLVPSEVWDRVNNNGLWDFVGSEMTPKYNGPDAPLLKVAGWEMDTFVRNIWPESDWESAWFMNPTRIQSVPGLAHFHVFARRKSENEKEHNTSLVNNAYGHAKAECSTPHTKN